MDNILKRDYLVLTSLCDAEGKLGIRNIFDIYMDMAAVHAAHLGVSYYDMLAYRCFWVAVRTRVKIYDRPALADSITAVTWPGKPGLAKMDRFYRLMQGDRVVSEGRTEWGVQDIDTGMVRRTSSYPYPVDLPYREERVCAEPFTLFRDSVEGEDEGEPLTYTVSSADIDVGRHMNNVAYIRMLLGLFTTEELRKMEISEVEISYRRACFEGEELRIYRRRAEGALRFRVVRPDGETAAHALFRTGGA